MLDDAEVSRILVINAHPGDVDSAPRAEGLEAWTVREVWISQHRRRPPDGTLRESGEAGTAPDRLPVLAGLSHLDVKPVRADDAQRGLHELAGQFRQAREEPERVRQARPTECRGWPQAWTARGPGR